MSLVFEIQFRSFFNLKLLVYWFNWTRNLFNIFFSLVINSIIWIWYIPKLVLFLLFLHLLALSSHISLLFRFFLLCLLRVRLTLSLLYLVTSFVFLTVVLPMVRGSISVIFAVWLAASYHKKSNSKKSDFKYCFWMGHYNCLK